MSVTFSVRGQVPDYETDHGWINLSGVNARAVLDALGIEGGPDLCGEIRGRELRLACETYLAKPTADAPKLGVIEARFVEFGRRSGYVSDRVKALLGLAALAGDLGIISFS